MMTLTNHIFGILTAANTHKSALIGNHTNLPREPLKTTTTRLGDSDTVKVGAKTDIPKGLKDPSRQIRSYDRSFTLAAQ